MWSQEEIKALLSPDFAALYPRAPLCYPFHLSLSRGYVLSMVLQIPAESWSAAKGSRAHLTHWGEPGTTDSVLRPRQTHGDNAGASEGNEGGPESRVTADTSHRDSPATGHSPECSPSPEGWAQAKQALLLRAQSWRPPGQQTEPSVPACKQTSKRLSLAIVR